MVRIFASIFAALALTPVALAAPAVVYDDGVPLVHAEEAGATFDSARVIEVDVARGEVVISTNAEGQVATKTLQPDNEAVLGTLVAGDVIAVYQEKGEVLVAPTAP